MSKTLHSLVLITAWMLALAACTAVDSGMGPQNAPEGRARVNPSGDLGGGSGGGGY
jgi:hypothetical protein